MLDSVRRVEPDIPTRPEMLRRLIERAAKAEKHSSLAVSPKPLRQPSKSDLEIERLRSGDWETQRDG